MVTRRQTMLRVRMTLEERKKLEQLADADGVTSSDVVRLFVRREHEKRFGAGKKKK